MTKEEAIWYLTPIAESASLERYKEALGLALTALRSQQEAEKNAPLTLDELREMGGGPVWLAFPGENFDDGWYIIVAVDRDRLHCLQLYAMLFFEHYGKTWLAYRRKPEEEAE